MTNQEMSIFQHYIPLDTKMFTNRDGEREQCLYIWKNNPVHNQIPPEISELNQIGDHKVGRHYNSMIAVCYDCGMQAEFDVTSVEYKAYAMGRYLSEPCIP